MNAIFTVALFLFAFMILVKNLRQPTVVTRESLQLWQRPVGAFTLFLAATPLVAMVATLAAASFGSGISVGVLIIGIMLAPFLVVPWTSEVNRAERLGHIAAAVTVLVGILVLQPLLVGDFFTHQFTDQYPLIMVGLIAVAGLFSATFAAAAAFGKRSLLPLVGFGAASGVGGLILGLLRSNVEGSVYSLPLATTSQEPIFWVMAPTAERPEGLRFAVSMQVPEMMWVLVALVAIAILVILLGLVLPSQTTLSRRLEQILLLAASICGIVASILTFSGVISLHLPTTELYTRLLSSVAGVAPTTAATLAGGFRLADHTLYEATQGLAIYIPGYVADLFFIHISTLAFIIATFLSFSKKENVDEKVKYFNDLARINTEATILLRAALFAALLMAGVGLYQISYLGVAWVASASEWVGVGLFTFTLALTLAVGAIRKVLLGSKNQHLWRRYDTILALLLIIWSFVVVLSVAWGAAFKTVVGYSARLF